MEWWQIAVLMLLGGMLAGGLQQQHARLSPPPVVPPPAPPAPSEPTNFAELAAALVAVRAEWAAYQKNLDAYFEALEDQAETVERTRRRVAARTSREKTDAPQEPSAITDRAAALARARSLGISV